MLSVPRLPDLPEPHLPRWVHVERMRAGREMTPRRADRLIHLRRGVMCESSLDAVSRTAVAAAGVCDRIIAYRLAHPSIAWC